jgi:hypothetical protein
MAGCFQIGLYRQGLLHDLSKYSPTEFWVGARYYRGYMSPNNAERAATGVSTAWLHHKGRNKHHLEYWIDYAKSEGTDEEAHKGMCGMKMPIRYVAEMFIDRVSASKNYNKEKYTDACPLEYYQKGKGAYMIHPDTEALLEYLLTMLAVRGEKETFSFVKYKLLKGKVPYEKAVLNRRTKALTGK